MAAPLGSSLLFSFANGSAFNLISVDLAEYSTGFQTPLTVPFIGYSVDGGTVTTNFTTDGIIDGSGPLTDFETFYFGPEWSGLTHVEILTIAWSLDNLVVAIPEPSSVVLVLSGGVFVWLVKLLKRRCKRAGSHW